MEKVGSHTSARHPYAKNARCPDVEGAWCLDLEGAQKLQFKVSDYKTDCGDILRDIIT